MNLYLSELSEKLERLKELKYKALREGLDQNESDEYKDLQNIEIKIVEWGDE